MQRGCHGSIPCKSRKRKRPATFLCSCIINGLLLRLNSTTYFNIFSGSTAVRVHPSRATIFWCSLLWCFFHDPIIHGTNLFTHNIVSNTISFVLQLQVIMNKCQVIQSLLLDRFLPSTRSFSAILFFRLFLDAPLQACSEF